MEIHGRTDLASEARSRCLRDAGDAARLRGVRAETSMLRGLSLSAVEILDEEGAALLGKAPGRYYTLALPAPLSRGDTRFADAAEAVKAILERKEGADK